MDTKVAPTSIDPTSIQKCGKKFVEGDSYLYVRRDGRYTQLSDHGMTEDNISYWQCCGGPTRDEERNFNRLTWWNAYCKSCAVKMGLLW